MPYGYFIMGLWLKLNNESYQKMAIRELENFRYSQEGYVGGLKNKP
jgi:hypothetical protein